MATKRILILRTGTTSEQVRSVHGDYDRWFTDAIAEPGLSFDVRDVTREPIPPAGGFAGIIVTGSTSAAYKHETWMGSLIRFLRNDGAAGPPLLGVCFGAQILVHARGGRVEPNPRGWEIGGIEVKVAPGAAEDPLFTGVENPFGALATHEDRIEELPAGAVLLASNEVTPVQALRIGDRVWGVQFHPEATAEILEKLIRLRAGFLERDAAAHGLDPAGHVERLVSTLRDARTAQGRRVLDNFVRVCLRWEGEPGRAGALPPATPSR